MLLPNRKPAGETGNLNNGSHNPNYRKWSAVPIITPLFILLALIVVMSAKADPALAYNEITVAGTGGVGVAAMLPAMVPAGEDGQTQPAPSDFLEDVTIWSATMTVREFPRAADFYGYSSHDSVGALDTDTFVVDGQTYTINVVALSPFGNALGIRLSPDLDTLDTSQLMLLVDGLDFSFADASIALGYEENETLVVWDESGLSWADGQQVSLRLIEWELGTCPVGEDVSADIQSVEDPT